MNFIAFLFALAAVFCFLLAAYGAGPNRTANNAGRSWHFGWVGLALLTISWMVQIIILTGSHLTVH